jgi:MarR family
VASWTFLTTHARVLLLVAHDPGVRLRDVAASLDVTERSAFGVISDLVEAGYVVKEKDGRRNRYHIQAHLPLPEPTARERTVGQVLALLIGADVTVTGKQAAAARSPGSGRDASRPRRNRCAATCRRASRRPVSARAGRNGDGPPRATAGGRRQGRDRRMGGE